MKRIAFILIMILLVAAVTVAALAFFASTEPMKPLKPKSVSERKSIEDRNRDTSRIDEVSINLRTPPQPEGQEAMEEPGEVEEEENILYRIRVGAKKFFTTIEKLIGILGF